jgi:MFS family permease
MDDTAQVAANATSSSPFSPLAEPLFRSLWMAAVISYTGSWMQNIATGWLMTSLTSSPMWVSLVQVALSLPVLLIALPAGALADMVDRRKFLLFTQSSMVAAALILGILTVTSTCTPTLLLFFTFLLGAGAFMNEPAWQALTPDLVPVSKLGSAVALNSAGFNMARAVGPALGGLVIATAGSGTAFLLNAVSFFGVILFLYRWKPAERPVGQVTTTFSGALIVGLRYIRQEKRITAVLIRTALFSLFASAFWALLPLIASRFGASGYGAMLAFFGLGALAGAGLLARARQKFGIFFCFCRSRWAGMDQYSGNSQYGGADCLPLLDTCPCHFHVCFSVAGWTCSRQSFLGCDGIAQQRPPHPHHRSRSADMRAGSRAVVPPAGAIINEIQEAHS